MRSLAIRRLWGGQKSLGALERHTVNTFVDSVAHQAKGERDSVRLFLPSSVGTTATQGRFGFLATNTIAQGDTREVGLDQLVKIDWTISRAVPSRGWQRYGKPGSPQVWPHLGHWNRAHY